MENKPFSEMIKNLSSSSLSINDKESIISQMIKIFNTDRIYTSLYIDSSTICIYTTLINLLFSENEIPPKTEQLIFNLLDLILLNIDCDKNIYNYVYQSLSKYYFNQKLLTEKIMLKYVTLLRHLYQNGNERTKILPKNYFYFHQNGSIKYSIIEQNTKLNINKGITILLWFRINLSQMKGNGIILTVCNSKNPEVTFSLSINKQAKTYVLQQSNTKLQFNHTNTDIPFADNEYILLSFSIKKEKIAVWICNNENKEYEYNITNANNIEIDTISFFDNCTGEASTILVLNQYLNKKELGLDYVFKKFPFGLPKFSKIEALLHLISIDFIFILSLPTYNSNSNKTIDNMFQDTPAQLIGNCGSHTYTNLPKKISNVGGAKSILPIIEMIYTASNNGIIKITNELLYEYFELIYSIVKSRKHNVKEIEEINLFQVLSLFVEKFPSEIFKLNIMNKFMDIKKSIIEFSRSLYQVFFENIMLNEKIYYKFETEVQSEFWTSLREQFECLDVNSVLSFLPMSKICLLLKYYDEKRYFEYCCENHKNAFISNINSRVMVPNFRSKTHTLIELVQNIINKVDISKSNEPLSLFQLLCLDLSPCLAKIIIQIFVNLFNNKNLYLKFKAGELAENSKSQFDDIVINLLSRSLPDVKSDVLHLIAVAKKNKKLEDEFIDGINYNINLSDAFYLSNQLNTTNTPNIIKKLSSHCANKIKHIDDGSTCDEFGDGKSLILSKNYFSTYAIGIYNSLFHILLNRPTENYSKASDLKLNDTDNIFNERIIEVLINFVTFCNDDYFTTKLNNDLNILFEKNLNNCYILYSNKILYNWTIINMYKGFQSTNKNEQQLFQIAKNINTKIFINTILQDRKIKKVLQSYPTMALNNLLTWGYNVRQGKDDNTKEKINKFIEFILKEYFTLLKSNLNKENSIEGNVFQNLITLFSIVLDYATLFKKDEGNFDMKEREHNLMIPQCFINNINVTYNNKWNEHELLSEIFYCFNQIWSFGQISKLCDGNLSYSDIISRNENLTRSLIYNKDNKNVFVKNLAILDYVFISDYNWKLSKCILIFLSIEIVLQRKNNNQEEISKWVTEMKNFVIFYILAANNLWEGSKISNSLIANTQIDSAYIMFFGISFFYEELIRKDTTEKYRTEIKNGLKDIFVLLVVIIDTINETMEKSKRFSFKNLFDKSSNRKELLEGGLYHLFCKEENNLNFSSMKMKIQSESNLSLDPFIIIGNDPNFKNFLLTNQNNKEILINYLNLDTYNEKIALRKKNYIVLSKIFISSLSKVNNHNRSDKIIKLIPKFQINVSKSSTGSFMIIKEKRNMYKKYKKELFLWKGMWSNNEDLYQNKLKLKVLNHYTKFLSRPLLIPILDIDYYVPNFTNFKTERMFKETSSNKINLDIDELLKSNSNDTTYLINTDETSNDMNYLNYIDFKTDRMIYKLNLNFTKKIFLSKEEDFMEFFSQLRVLSKNENLRKYENFYHCCFVKPSHHIKGVFFVNESNISFRVFINQIKGNNIISDEDFESDSSNKNRGNFKVYDDGFDFERNTCFGSYFVYHDKDKDTLTFTIPYDKMIYLFRRRYYQRNNSVEFFSKNHKSYYFVFKSEKDREGVIKDILSHFKDQETKKLKIDLCKNKDDFENIIGYEITKKSFLSITKKKKLSNIIKKWQNYKISNFEFLMMLNLYGNRSFSDLSQYPVFPWIISNYDVPTLSYPKDFRELSLPMGMMTLTPAGESRKLTYIENFEMIEEEAKEGGMNGQTPIPFYFGSHYSNPIYVVHYLTRLFPYSHISIELQGDKFDKADRLFLNVNNSFTCAASSKGDVRELIPEFYYLPEMFENVNQLNLGTTQDDTSVDNTVCPKWSGGNPFKFVYLMRKWLESNEISKVINQWIDLIFGYKQKGKEAVNAFNVFFPDSYEVNVDKMKTREEKVVKLKMVEFGLTPKQISTVEFPVKKKENEARKLTDEVINWMCAPLNVKTGGWGKNTKYRNLIGFKVVGSEKLIGIYRENDDIKLFKFPNASLHNINNAILKQSNTISGSQTENRLKPSKTITKGVSKEESNTLKVLNQKDIKGTKKFNYLGKLNKYYNLTSNEYNPPILFIQNSSSNSVTVIQGGFYDSKLLLTVVDTSHTDSPQLPTSPSQSSSQQNAQFQESSKDSSHIKMFKTFFVSKSPYPITSLCTMTIPHNKKELFIIAGNSIGHITLLSFTSPATITALKTFINNSSTITDITYSNNLNIIATASSDGYINLYTIPQFRLFRSIYLPSKSCDYIFCSSCPLASVVIFSNNENIIETFSINGKKIGSFVEANGFKSPKLIRDSNFCDGIIYISGRKVITRSIPYLELMSEVSLTIRDAEMLEIDEEMKICYVSNLQGNEWVYIYNKEIEIK